MDKLTKLSEAIRYGSTFITEANVWMLTNGDGETRACALGTAYIAAGFSREGFPLSYDIECRLSERFGVPIPVLQRVSVDHYTGRMTRAQCADWLEAQGY